MSERAGQRPVLLLMRNPAYVRNFEPVIRALVDRKLTVVALFEERKDRGDEMGLSLIDRLADDLPGVSHEMLGLMPLGLPSRVRLGLKAVQDYLRYFDPPYEDPSRLRARALAFVPARVERVFAAAMRRSARLRGGIRELCRRFDGALGPEPEIRAELARRRPAALVVTPMVHFRSRQNDWVQAARELGIPSALCINGWDNFTNKGLMHAQPDLVAVWNESQGAEAVELHGVAPEALAVTGAWPYEHWFEWAPSRSRADFCAEVGLDRDEAIILYVCSSRFIAEHERAAVGQWVSAIRGSRHAKLARANVIVRPHPLNDEQWAEPWPTEVPGVVIFPREGLDPVDERTRADYFDSLTHADAVVGINTSALIESAIVDRPALAFPAPHFRSTQEELPHFRRLIGEEGMVATSADMAGHLAKLDRILANGTATEGMRQRFVDSFILPSEPGDSPAERVAEAIEGLLGRD